MSDLWAIDFGPEHGKALFSLKCPTCSRFFSGKSIVCEVNGLGETRSTATCKKCGSIQPDFQGWF